MHVLFDSNLSGGQIFAVRLGEALQAHGWESEYVLPSHGPLVAALESSRLRHNIVSARSPLLLAEALRRLYKVRRPNLIHTHLVIPTQFAARLAAAVAGTPIVCHYHIAPVLPDGRVRAHLYSAIDRIGANHFTDENIAVSDGVAEAMLTAGYNNFILLRNGVALPDGNLPASVDGPIVILGRVTRQKGQDVAIAAIKRLHGPECEVRLRIVGDAITSDDHDFRALITREASSLAGRVDFVPAYPAASMVELARAAVLVLPSRGREGTPLSALEAMAAGVPVIGADVPGVRDLLKGGAGLLFPEGDDSALAEAIGELRRNEQARIAIVDAALDRVRSQYDLKNLASAVASTYANAEARRRP